MSEDQKPQNSTTLKVGDRYPQGDWIWEVIEVAGDRVKARRACKVFTIEQKIEDILPQPALTVNELRLASLLFEARSALWREWVETGSVAAKKAFDDTDPLEVANHGR